MNKKIFYILSFTWGLPLTLLGCTVALVLRATGHKPNRWGWCWYFEVGQDWGGLNLGVFFFTSKNPYVSTKNHEFGHAIQNCYFGILTPFIVLVPSSIRYWYRELIYWRRGNIPPTDYDDIWFEGQATRIGTEYINKIKRGRTNAKL